MKICEPLQPRYDSLIGQGISLCRNSSWLSDKKNHTCVMERVNKLFIAVPFIILCAIADLLFWIAKTVIVVPLIIASVKGKLLSHWLDFISSVITPIIAIIQAILFNRLPEAKRGLPRAVLPTSKTSLEMAIDKKDYAEVERFIAQGGDPITFNRPGENAYTLAAKAADPKMMQILCSGDPVNVKKSINSTENRVRYPALHACFVNNAGLNLPINSERIAQEQMDRCLKTVEVMLKVGADPNAQIIPGKDSTRSSTIFNAWLEVFASSYYLMYEYQVKFHEDLIELALDYGADPRMVNRDTNRGVKGFSFVLETTGSSAVLRESIVNKMLRKGSTLTFT